MQPLCPSSQLITFTCCSSCKSTPPVTCTTPVTHLDGLSGELRGIIQLSAWESQQSGRCAACDPKQTSCRRSALYFFILRCCFFFSVCGASNHLTSINTSGAPGVTHTREYWSPCTVPILMLVLGGWQYIFISILLEHSAIDCFILTEKPILQKLSLLKYVIA